MEYFDDILNVYAYLRQQAQQEARKLGDIGRDLRQLQQDISHTSGQLDGLETEADNFLQKAMAMAEKLGVDISDLAGAPVAEKHPEEDKPAILPSGKIRFPKDYDFHEGFAKLVEQAHAAGFTDVHPEELLTPEEMENARAFGSQLDEQFAEATRLRGKDLAVLMAAVAVRLALRFIKTEKSDPLKASAEKADPTAAQPVTDAASGVDIQSILRENGGYDSPVAAPVASSGSGLEGFSGFFGGAPQIRSRSRILREQPSFDIQESELLPRDQIVGFDKYLGWLFGVTNILTDTVTSKQMKSYTVARFPEAEAKPLVDQEVSTLASVLYPAIRAADANKESVIAAVVQEAVALGVDTDGRSTLQLYEQAADLEQRSSELASQTGSVLSSFWEGKDIVQDSLVNTIVAAVHSLCYGSEDGDLNLYAIRTNNIILYSSVIAALAGNLPALVSKDVSKMDPASIITALLSLFYSTSFWIEVKTDFLVNAYKAELQPILDQLNEKFEFV